MTEINTGEKISGEFNKIYPKPRIARITGRVTNSYKKGVEGAKYLVSVKLHLGKKSKEAGSMFLKTLGNTDVPWDSYSPEDTIEKYYWLKKHGLPVPPTMRLDQKLGQFIMTDLTQGGKYHIIDKHRGPIKGSIKNSEDVENQIREIARQAYANGNGVYLDYDAYTIVIDDLGIGKAFVVDIGLCSHRIFAGSSKKGNKVTLSSAQNQAEWFINDYVIPSQ